MKNFFKCLTSFLNSIAEARTAATLSNLGKYDEAKKIYNR